MLYEVRPHLDLHITEPASLHRELERFEPHLVLLYGSPSRAPIGVPAWVRVTSADRLEATACVDGRYSRMERMKVDDLLALIDEADRLVSQEE